MLVRLESCVSGGLSWFCSLDSIEIGVDVGGRAVSRHHFPHNIALVVFMFLVTHRKSRNVRSAECENSHGDIGNVTLAFLGHDCLFQPKNAMYVVHKSRRLLWSLQPASN